MKERGKKEGIRDILKAEGAAGGTMLDQIGSVRSNSSDTSPYERSPVPR